MKYFTSLTIPILASLMLACCSLFSHQIPMTTPATIIPDNAKVATFAGGCFWCLQPPFDSEM